MSPCPVTFSSSQAFNAEREAELAADQLGSLLFDTPEFQTYIRLSRAVNLDEAVKALRCQIREQQTVYAGPQAEQPSLEALYASLEAVPKKDARIPPGRARPAPVVHAGRRPDQRRRPGPLRPLRPLRLRLRTLKFQARAACPKYFFVVGCATRF